MFGPTEEGAEEEEAEPDPNLFTVDPDLVDEAGGGPVDPHAVDPTKMGLFTYVEFDTVDDLFEYTQQEGYGWDPEIPSVCFGF